MDKRILVVEDDRELAGILQMHLKDMGFTVDLAHDGTTGKKQATEGGYDLLILDVMLPGTDGLDICKAVRSAPGYTPILMLTCLSSEVDKVIGLELGADDYMTKPFSVRELLARVKAILRRADALAKEDESDEPETIQRGGINIDVKKRVVTVDGNPVKLTAKEFDLLVFFAQDPGRVYTRSQLLNSVWGYGYEGYSYTVNSHINNLRSKIETDRDNPKYILTVWGVGYKFSEEEE
jgi:DNA-binding response OmpR family regulator